MIRNPEKLKQLEEEFIKNEGSLTFEKSLKIYDSMWHEAENLGIFLAKILNSCLKNS